MENEIELNMKLPRDFAACRARARASTFINRPSFKSTGPSVPLHRAPDVTQFVKIWRGNREIGKRSRTFRMCLGFYRDVLHASELVYLAYSQNIEYVDSSNDKDHHALTSVMMIGDVNIRFQRVFVEIHRVVPCFGH